MFATTWCWAYVEAAVSQEVERGFSFFYDVGDSTVSMAGWLWRHYWVLERPSQPGNHHSNQKTKMKIRTLLAHRRSNIWENIIIYHSTDQSIALGNNMFDDGSPF